MHIRATSTFSLWSSPIDPQRKEIKLFTWESSQQAKEEREIFLGFLFNYYYSMKSKLAKKLQLFFCFFLRFIKHTRRKREKENKLAWILQ